MPQLARPAGVLHYEAAGAGEPVLLLPGLGMDGGAWALQTAALREHSQVIALDNRGSGRSMAPPGDYTLAGLARDAVDLLDHLDIATASVVGASFGGMIAQVMAATYANRVNRLVLVTTTARGDTETGALFDEIDRLARGAGVVEAMVHLLDRCYTPPFLREQAAIVEGIRRLVRENPPSLTGYLGQLAALRTCNTEELLEKIHMPVLVLAAEEDQVFPMKHSQALVAGLPNALLEPVPGGHGCIVEASRVVNTALSTFLLAE